MIVCVFNENSKFKVIWINFYIHDSNFRNFIFLLLLKHNFHSQKKFLLLLIVMVTSKFHTMSVSHNTGNWLFMKSCTCISIYWSTICFFLALLNPGAKKRALYAAKTCHYNKNFNRAIIDCWFKRFKAVVLFMDDWKTRYKTI